MTTPHQYPVDLKIVATVYDPETKQPVETIEVDMTTVAPMQTLAVELDRRGYDPMTYDAEFRTWRAVQRAQRV
jgi:hypothetical protein